MAQGEDVVDAAPVKRVTLFLGLLFYLSLWEYPRGVHRPPRGVHRPPRGVHCPPSRGPRNKPSFQMTCFISGQGGVGVKSWSSNRGATCVGGGGGGGGARTLKGWVTFWLTVLFTPIGDSDHRMELTIRSYLSPATFYWQLFTCNFFALEVPLKARGLLFLRSTWRKISSDSYHRTTFRIFFFFLFSGQRTALEWRFLPFENRENP